VIPYIKDLFRRIADDPVLGRRVWRILLMAGSSAGVQLLGMPDLKTISLRELCFRVAVVAVSGLAGAINLGEMNDKDAAPQAVKPPKD
jgi:hypothetical protein